MKALFMSKANKLTTWIGCDQMPTFCSSIIVMTKYFESYKEVRDFVYKSKLLGDMKWTIVPQYNTNLQVKEPGRLPTKSKEMLTPLFTSPTKSLDAYHKLQMVLINSYSAFDRPSRSCKVLDNMLETRLIFIESNMLGQRK